MTDKKTFLIDESDSSRAAAVNLIDDLPRAKRWLLTLEEHSAKRNSSYNAYYWTAIITPAAEQLGYESTEDLHELICCELYGSQEVTFMGHTQLKPNRTTTSPTTMTKIEFQAHCDRAAALLANQGVLLPAGDRWYA